MAPKKPLVVVTRKLPDAIETRMMELFDAKLNVDVLVVSANLGKRGGRLEPSDRRPAAVAVRARDGLPRAFPAPRVSDRIASLVIEHAQRVRPDADALSQLLQQADPSDVASFAQLLGDPSALRQGARRTRPSNR